MKTGASGFDRALRDAGISREEYSDAQAEISSIPEQINQAIRQGKPREQIQAIFTQTGHATATDTLSLGHSATNDEEDNGGRAARDLFLVVGGVTVAFSLEFKGAVIHPERKSSKVSSK